MKDIISTAIFSVSQSAVVCGVNMWTQQGRGMGRQEDGRGHEESEEDEEEKVREEDSSGVCNEYSQSLEWWLYGRT